MTVSHSCWTNQHSPFPSHSLLQCPTPCLFSGNLSPEVLSRLSSNREASVANRHLVANFGKAVPLGDTKHMILIVTNRTPIPSSVRSWLDTFGVEDVSKLTGRTETRAIETTMGKREVQLSRRMNAFRQCEALCACLGVTMICHDAHLNPLAPLIPLFRRPHGTLWRRQGRKVCSHQAVRWCREDGTF